MNCSEAHSRLSAYHDGELSAEASAEVAAHLVACPSCAAEVEVFRKLSSMTRRLTDPPMPAGDWEELNAKLSSNRGSIPTFNWLASRSLAAAAAILVLSTAAFIAFAKWRAGHDREVAQTFGSFLEEFESQPQAAQQILLTRYEGRTTTLDQASDQLGYTPVIARELPPGCKAHEAYLLSMPCCKCMEIVCEQEDGHSIAIFEHDEGRPGWFGDRKSIECLCHSVPTSVTQIGNDLAATWKNGKRYLTVIGARDLHEVTEFVAFYNAIVPQDG